jgi:hypothetical protein
VHKGESGFTPTTYVHAMVDKLLIETWIGQGNYSAFFEKCKPELCTYSYQSRASAIVVLTTIISLFGGLSVVMKTVAPIIVKVYMRVTREKQSIQPSSVGQATTSRDDKRKQSSVSAEKLS